MASVEEVNRQVNACFTNEQTAMIQKFQDNLQRVLKFVKDERLKRSFEFEADYVLGLVYRFESEARNK